MYMYSLPQPSSVFGNENDKHRANLDPASGLLPPPAPLSSVSKTRGVINLSAGYLAAVDDEVSGRGIVGVALTVYQTCIG